MLGKKGGAGAHPGTSVRFHLKRPLVDEPCMITLAVADVLLSSDQQATALISLLASHTAHLTARDRQTSLVLVENRVRVHPFTCRYGLISSPPPSYD